jgi:hypothetical protein
MVKHFPRHASLIVEHERDAPKACHCKTDRRTLMEVGVNKVYSPECRNKRSCAE